MSNTPRKGISWYISIPHDQEIKATAEYVKNAYLHMRFCNEAPDFIIVDTVGKGAALLDELKAMDLPVEKSLTLSSLEMAANSELFALRKENAILRQGMKGDYDLDAWLKFVTQQILVAKTGQSDDAIRALWRNAGGDFHGPIVETGTMPEKQLLPFLRGLIGREPTKEALQSIAADIASRVAKNAGTVPQVTFPHIYLGLKDLFDGKYDDIAHLTSADVVIIDKDSKMNIGHFAMPCTLCERAKRLPDETEYTGTTLAWAQRIPDELVCLKHREKLKQLKENGHD